MVLDGILRVFTEFSAWASGRTPGVFASEPNLMSATFDAPPVRNWPARLPPSIHGHRYLRDYVDMSCTQFSGTQSFAALGVCVATELTVSCAMVLAVVPNGRQAWPGPRVRLTYSSLHSGLPGICAVLRPQLGAVAALAWHRLQRRCG